MTFRLTSISSSVRLLCAAAGSLLLVSCSTERYDSQSPLAKRTDFQDPEITTWVWGKYIDEDSPLEYYVKFRNQSKTIVSFDYTIADKPNVPHLDRNGPNSGFIANLYPGAEVAIPNPWKRRDVMVKLGKITRGKRPLDQLNTMYPQDVSAAAGAGGSPTLSDVLPAN